MCESETATVPEPNPILVTRATREIRNAIIDGVHGQTGTITN